MFFPKVLAHSRKGLAGSFIQWNTKIPLSNMIVHAQPGPLLFRL